MLDHYDDADLNDEELPADILNIISSMTSVIKDMTSTNSKESSCEMEASHKMI